MPLKNCVVPKITVATPANAVIVGNLSDETMATQTNTETPGGNAPPRNRTDAKAAKTHADGVPDLRGPEAEPLSTDPTQDPDFLAVSATVAAGLHRIQTDGTIVPESAELALALTHLGETLGADFSGSKSASRGGTEQDEVAANLLAVIESLPIIPLEGAETEPRELSIGSTLGEGGMGIVRSARQRSIGRDVAVKTTRAESPKDTDTLALLREAWITGILEHPNIVPVYALGRDEENRPFFSMKRIEGQPWDVLLRESVEPEAEAASGTVAEHIRILIRVCEAIEYAHDREIVHRDLKPENVMVGHFGEVYVLDWGIAVSISREANERLPRASDVRSLAGTPSYMAPEMVQSRGDLIDGRTDVFMLGGCLHEILTGRPPNRGASVMAVIASALRCDPPSLDGAEPELAEICSIALAKKPEDRFASVAELRERLELFLEHRVSIRLTRKANDRLHNLEEILARASGETPALNDGSGLSPLDSFTGVDPETLAASKKDAAREVYASFAECRFGFREALSSWRENDEAARGEAKALVLMVEFEISQRNAAAARGWLAELEATCDQTSTTHLRAALDELEEELAKTADEIEKLREIEAANDVSIGASERGKGALLIGLAWLLTNFGLGHLERHYQLEIAHEQYVVGGLALFILSGLYFYLKRDSFMANEAGKRIMGATLIGWVVTLSTMPVTWAMGMPFWMSAASVMFILGVVIAMMSAFLDLRLLGGTLVAFFAAVDIAIWPQYVHEMIGIGNFLAFAVFAWVWRPADFCIREAAVCKVVELTTPRQTPS